MPTPDPANALGPFYAVLHINGNLETHLSRPDLAHLQAAVRGYILPVVASLAGQRVTLYVNEQGIQDGLRLNRWASGLFGVQLVGPVVIIGGPDPAGLDTGLSGAALATVKAYLEQRGAR